MNGTAFDVIVRSSLGTSSPKASSWSFKAVLTACSRSPGSRGNVEIDGVRGLRGDGAKTVLNFRLWRGVDIGPLLAGFGVVGLAISFGSQALVRDIMSGIFFMADDAFRVGEYVDTGRLKGTMEKITMRSVQLRHQSGLVHTVPFGQLQAITNASRDWATVKFNIRLERGIDLDQARKIIKRRPRDARGSRARA